MWRLKLKVASPTAPLHQAHVFDAVTGDEVSEFFPVRCANRLFRSLVTGRPIKVPVFKLDDSGRYFLDDEREVAIRQELVLVEGLI